MNILDNEMVRGYWDGKEDKRIELPKEHNYSPAYVHGWLNGRDDRIHKPRATDEVLRARAREIENNERAGE
jgi:hypothetical protein